MNYDTPKLCQQQTLNFARSVLQRHLALEAKGYLCNTEEMLDILLVIAAKRDTLESTCESALYRPGGAVSKLYDGPADRAHETPDGVVGLCRDCL